MKTILSLVATLACIMPAVGQIDHFPGHRWKEVKTEHFAIRTLSATPSVAKKYAEKVWEICDRSLPGLKEEYANNTFKTPDGASGSDEKPYRFTIYIVKRIYPFKEMVDKVAKDMGERAAGFKKVAMETKMMSDSRHRYVVFCLEDRQGDIDALLVHSVASGILAGHARMTKGNFFHTAGFGYYVEHLIFKKCRVHYLDFSQYYEQVEVVRGTVLDGNSAWTRPVQKMVKRDLVTPRLREIFGTVVAQVNPPRSGMMFALAHFMCHTDENVKKHHQYIGKLRGGEDPSVDLIMECFGYKSESDFNKAFKEYIESRDFR